jgi:hypothetical protein
MVVTSRFRFFKLVRWRDRNCLEVGEPVSDKSPALIDTSLKKNARQRKMAVFILK